MLAPTLPYLASNRYHAAIDISETRINLSELVLPNNLMSLILGVCQKVLLSEGSPYLVSNRYHAAIDISQTRIN